jgi:hypothetical protein
MSNLASAWFQRKSKLSILTMGRDKEKSRGKDLPNVVRRVGADSFYHGFEIFVDPTDNPDIGKIVMVKMKSRVALDRMTRSNKRSQSPPREAAPLLKAKNEEKEKWWTLGREMKDSKSKRKSSLTDLCLSQC